MLACVLVSAVSPSSGYDPAFAFRQPYVPATPPGLPGTQTSSLTPIPITAGLRPDAALHRCLGTSEEIRDREEMEPHVAVHPRDPEHVVAAWMVRSSSGGAIQAASSRDGGRSWTSPVTLPVNECASGPDGLRHASDPWVSVGPDGRVYVNAVGWRAGDGIDSANALIVTVSDDGGDTWEGPVTVSSGRNGNRMFDNSSVAASPHRRDVAYLTSTLYREDVEPAPAVVFGSRDGGRTWSKPRIVTPTTPEDSWASAPQVLFGRRAGSLHVFYAHGDGGSRISMVQSRNGGNSWSAPFPVATSRPLSAPPHFPGTDRELSVAPGIMYPALDRESGDLYVTFTAPARSDSTASAVWLTRSPDQGETWGPPVQVSPAPAWRPSLSASPPGGTAVTYFRPAGDNPTTDVLPTAVELVECQGTGDRSVRCGRGTRIDRFGWKPRESGAYFLGDYQGLVATRDGPLAVYARMDEAGMRVVARRAVSR